MADSSNIRTLSLRYFFHQTEHGKNAAKALHAMITGQGHNGVELNDPYTVTIMHIPEDLGIEVMSMMHEPDSDGNIRPISNWKMSTFKNLDTLNRLAGTIPDNLFSGPN